STTYSPPCWNCASHSIVCHEFGHISLYMLGLGAVGNGGFHEGYADSFATMVNDDDVFARGQFMNGSSGREDPTGSSINCQYPISVHPTSECNCIDVHKAGQLLSGPWVRIRRAFKAQYGVVDGLERARALFGRWSFVTLGGTSDCDAANPAILEEVLGVCKS